MTDGIKLKPCPFCGGEARIMRMGYPHWIYCTECGAKVHGGEINEADGVKASAEAWNARAYGWIPCSERLPAE